jgi:hypothetical protein
MPMEVIPHVHALALCNNMHVGLAFGDSTGQAAPDDKNDSNDESYDPTEDSDKDDDDNDSHITGVYHNNDNNNDKEYEANETENNDNKQCAANYHEANKMITVSNVPFFGMSTISKYHTLIQM